MKYDSEYRCQAGCVVTMSVLIIQVLFLTFLSGRCLAIRSTSHLGAGDDLKTRCTKTQGTYTLSWFSTSDFICKEHSSAKKAIILGILIRYY